VNLDALITSTVLVATSEIGDKTQLLSFMLAARLRQPVAIICGIFVATLVNHALAAEVGKLIAGWLAPSILQWGTGLLFIGFGLWALVPDKFEGEVKLHPAGAFVTAGVAFFLAEMGDKTQLATLTLGARFDSLTQVVAGTTLGMMLADVPAVLIGARLADRLPLKQVRYAAAALFVATGVWTLLSKA
jgi:putative Ca2+/H+ antiporter (TMEM165/GDT1 family)